jgi:hypothetical protein
MEGESGRLRCVERFCPPYIEGQPRYQMPHRSRSGVCCLLPPFLSFCSLFVYTAIALSLLSPQKLVLVRHRTQLVRRIIPKVLSCSLTYSVYCAVPLAWSCSLLLSPVFVILIVLLPACNCINFKSPSSLSHTSLSARAVRPDQRSEPLLSSTSRSSFLPCHDPLQRATVHTLSHSSCAFPSSPTPWPQFVKTLILRSRLR